ncbi:MAG: hypothetical protein FJX76_23260 [Armatimonadetes bacterium]|nr:hypothetical protein [Armatimonadota bacterium]
MSKRPIWALCLFLSVLLTACGGGGSVETSGASHSVGILGDASAPVAASPTTSAFVSGTAATGAAIGNAEVTVRDATPVTRLGATDGAGRFNVDVGGLRPPLLLRVRRPDGSVVFGLANSAGTANVTPATDLILRLFFRMHGTTPTAAFNSLNPSTPLPSPAQIAALVGFVNASLQASLDEHGLDSAEFDPMGDPFAANGQGYDGVLDDLTLSPDEETLTVRLDGATQAITYTVDVSADVPVCTFQTTTRGGGGEQTSSRISTLLPGPPASFLAQALVDLDGLVRRLTATVNARGALLSDADMIPLMASNYLDRGNDRASAAALLAETLRGQTITAASVRRIERVDAQDGVVSLDLLFTLRDNDHEVPLAMRVVCRRNPDGSWLMLGDQQAAFARVFVENCVAYRAAGRSVYPRQRAEVRLVHGAATAVTAEGGAFVNADVPLEPQQQVVILRPDAQATRTVLHDVFSLSTPDTPAPPPGTLYTLTLDTGGASPVIVDRSHATTSEGLAMTLRHDGQAVTGHALADAHLGEILDVRWELPHTFAVESLSLRATLRTAHFQTVAGAGGLARGATSATLSLPSEVNGEPVTSVLLALEVTGSAGERVHLSWDFSDAPPPAPNDPPSPPADENPPPPAPGGENPPPVTGSDTVPIGVNLDFNSDWSRELVFVDAMKSARRFGTVQTPWDMSAPVDANGWPTSDFGVVVMANIPSASGTYSLVCEGPATVSLGPATPGSTVTNQHYDAGSNTTIADINLPPNANPAFTYDMMLRFTGTNGGCRNIRLMRPGYPRNTTQTFNTAFVQRLAPFSIVRFMQFFSMQENQVSEWRERTRPEYGTQTSNRGAAYEYAIQLANETHKDIWLSIPDLATDDHIRQLARLLRDSLDADRAVYIEHSNEVWNFAYPQNRRNFDAASVEGNAGPSALNDFGQTMNPGYWSWRRFARRGIQISNIFREELGDAQMMTRVRPVLASQVGYRYMIDHQLRWLNATYGPPRNYFYAIAGAPYWGPSGSDRERTDLTVDSILDLCEASLNSQIPDFQPDAGYSGVLDWGNIPGYATLARYYGLRNMCYEGGPDTAGEASLTNKIAANYDPRMGDLVERFLRRWYANPDNDALVYYKLGGGDSQYGQFQLYTDITLPTVKSQAVERVANTPRSQIVANPSP